MALDPCAKRFRLSKPVVNAITQVYRAKTDYDAARQKQAVNADALAVVLQGARGAERMAVRARAEHIRDAKPRKDPKKCPRRNL
jgi:hypothetical protein